MCRSRAETFSTRRCSRAARCCSTPRLRCFSRLRVRPVSPGRDPAASATTRGRTATCGRRVTAAHDLRDGKFGGDAARQRAVDTGERYDLIVVGGGMSGLGAAAFFQKLKGGRVLVLDNHPMVGGEAKRNEFDVDGVRLIGPQGSNDFGTRLPQGWVGDYWKDLGLPSRHRRVRASGVGRGRHAARDRARQLLLPALGRRVREPRLLLQGA